MSSECLQVSPYIIVVVIYRIHSPFICLLILMQGRANFSKLGGEQALHRKKRVPWQRVQKNSKHMPKLESKGKFFFRKGVTLHRQSTVSSQRQAVRGTYVTLLFWTYILRFLCANTNILILDITAHIVLPLVIKKKMLLPSQYYTIITNYISK